MRVLREDDADRLVTALCDAPLAAWRAAVLATVGDPREPLAAMALERAIPSADRARLWYLYDDLETALHRLTTDEEPGCVRGARTCSCMRATTRRAIAAIVCRDALRPHDVRVLAGPLLALGVAARPASAR